VGILSITGKEFNLEKIRLKTVRPFVMRDIVLSEVPRFAKKASDKSKEAVINYLREQVSVTKDIVNNRSKKRLKKPIHSGLNLRIPIVKIFLLLFP
jgi:hypothetical protein